MADGLKKGDRVRWKAGAGTVSGTVERVITTKAKVRGRTIAGSKDDPRYVVKNSETGKSVVLKRPSLRKAGGRAAAPKAAAGRAKARDAAKRKEPAEPAGQRGTRRRVAAAPVPPADEAAAPATAVERPVEVAQMRTPRTAATRRRWAAAGALLAAVVIITGIVLLSTGDDDDDGGEAAAPVETATETTGTTAEPVSGEPTPEAIAALGEEPFLITGVESIPEQRLGDQQETLASQFQATYSQAQAGLAEVSGASEGTDALSVAAAYVIAELKIDRAITNAFVRESFNDGDSASVLATKTEQTERALRRQLDAAAELDPPDEAAALQAAFVAARNANLAYLQAVSAAISSGDQAALDQALRDGRAAAARAGRRIEGAAQTLQDELESETGAAGAN